MPCAIIAHCQYPLAVHLAPLPPLLGHHRSQLVIIIIITYIIDHCHRPMRLDAPSFCLVFGFLFA